MTGGFCQVSTISNQGNSGGATITILACVLLFTIGVLLCIKHIRSINKTQRVTGSTGDSDDNYESYDSPRRSSRKSPKRFVNRAKPELTAQALRKRELEQPLALVYDDASHCINKNRFAGFKFSGRINWNGQELSPKLKFLGVRAVSEHGSEHQDSSKRSSRTSLPSFDAEVWKIESDKLE